MTKLIAGIDEAGRGPVIGPLVLAGVLLDEKQIDILVKIGVKDSKRLTPKKRMELSQLIEKIAVKLIHVEVQPEEIDKRVKRRITLNQLEARKIASMINKLRPDRVYVDCPDVNPTRFAEQLRNNVKFKEVEIITMHYADQNVPVVSAASIMAKVRRDQRVKELAQELGEIGSGYTSDPRTQLYVQNIFKKNSSSGHTKYIRSSWKTVKRLKK
nr:ribonuclease HII [Candidatus Njordarchaeota archaeon]